MQVFCMAPVSALGAVAMFYLLLRLLGSVRSALWLSLLYAFGTPVFFRTGFLNHNMMLGHVAFLGFLVLWNPDQEIRWPDWVRYFLSGVAGGMCLLFDYSGVVLLGGLFLYVAAKTANIRATAMYVAGSIPPILLLWLYQWRSFGNPFLPGQHWMPPVEWIEVGYQGFTSPQPDLLFHLLFDYRYGLFTTCPLMLLALLAPWWNRKRAIPRLEFAALLMIPLALLLFCSGISYTRLQYNNGMRYLAPLLPFLFVPVALVWTRLPRTLAYVIAIAAVAQAWSMAMYRDVERGLGVLEPILHVFLGGFQLPMLSVISRMKGQFGDYTANGASPLPMFALAGALIFVIWQRSKPEAKLRPNLTVRATIQNEKKEQRECQIHT
jgi:hypothetical protein